MNARGPFDTRVLSNTPLCREHFRLTLAGPRVADTQPGQFVQALCVGDDSPAFMLRRPFSLAGRRDTDDGVELDLIARAIGPGTRHLRSLRPGDTLNLLGPLGNAFTLPPAGGVALLVGGGVGIPPMLYLADAIARASGNAGDDRPTGDAAVRPTGDAAVRPTRAVAFCGAMSRDLLPLSITDAAPPPAGDRIEPLYNVAEFDAHGIPAVLSTDDGSYGTKGFVTDTLRGYLDQFLTDTADRARTVIYACGPEGMLKAVADVAKRRGVACQVCVERAMACGLGTCQSCVIRVQKPDPAAAPMAGSDWCYRLACTDGPVFDADVLRW